MTTATREWARRIGASEWAVEFFRECDVIDLHVDTYIWTRLFGYNLGAEHSRRGLPRYFLNHCDLPLLREASVNGAFWVVTTNPLRPRRERARVTRQNLQNLAGRLASAGATVVNSTGEFRSAAERGQHAAWLAVQGGNAWGDLQHDALVEALRADRVALVTLLHLTHSELGRSSSPLPWWSDGLTERGREVASAVQHAGAFVDLAHASERTFWDTLQALPTARVVLSHTGIRAQRNLWRNVSDEMLRAVGDRGGFVGVILEEAFLAGRGQTTCDDVAWAIEHIARVAGEDAVALGSDFDGAIVPPSELPSPLYLPRLLDACRNRGMTSALLRKFLGHNLLRACNFS